MRISGTDLLHRTSPQSGAHLHETETQRGNTARAKRNKIGLIPTRNRWAGESWWRVTLVRRNSAVAARAIENWAARIEVALPSPQSRYR
ncbi:hypothetical protein R1flu_013760 [Riccia fluitans]|uniref:Uncharacterized protein n=1 Tax=Riccia fluitans TaxID=41844 RepID=A0ABD1YE52_9MARC